MVKKYNENKVCPNCFSTVESFGKHSLNQWRCTNPLCRNSKYNLGYLIGENLIERSHIQIKIYPWPIEDNVIFFTE
jgi:tRNA(Ile2) C34 agmatinyltransferase TiaS